MRNTGVLEILHADGEDCDEYFCMTCNACNGVSRDSADVYHSKQVAAVAAGINDDVNGDVMLMSLENLDHPHTVSSLHAPLAEGASRHALPCRVMSRSSDPQLIGCKLNTKRIRSDMSTEIPSGFPLPKERVGSYHELKEFNNTTCTVKEYMLAPIIWKKDMGKFASRSLVSLVLSQLMGDEG